MRRLAVILILVLVVLLAAVTGLGWYLSGDEAFLKSQLNRIVQKQTGRSLQVDGRLHLDLGRVTTVEAEGMRFSNAAWAGEPEMVRVGRLVLAVDLPSLWHSGPPVLPRLLIEDCRVSLTEDESGQKNWELVEASTEQAKARTGPLVLLPDLELRGCVLELDSPRRQERLVAEFEAVDLQLPDSGRLSGSIDARLNGDALQAKGWLQPLFALESGGRLEHEVDLQFGAVQLHSSGSVAETQDWSGVNIQGYLRGPDVAKLLEPFALPALSEGAFDFRVGLNSEGDSTRIEVDGDLGSIDAQVRGELDRLVSPTAGDVDLDITGPDLAALGQAMKMDGLVQEPYRLQAKAVFDGTLVQIESARLQAGPDSLAVSGSINAVEGLAGSELAVTLASDEIGHWAPLAGQPVKPVGPVKLQGTVSVDPAGILSLDTNLVSGASRLTARGSLGPLKGPLAPDLVLDLQTPDPRPWGALAGFDRLPAAPLHVQGQVDYRGEQLQLRDVQLTLDDHGATARGVLNLAGDHAGSRLDLELDIKDVARLGHAFGVQDLPDQPLQLALKLKPEGKGLAFDIGDGKLGSVRLVASGRIPDLAKPLAVDADFLLRLPSLQDLEFLLPEQQLPDQPFQIQGRLVNGTDQTRVEKIEAELGTLNANMDGMIGHEGSFDVNVAVHGTDLSILKDLAGRPLPQQPFSVAGQLRGNRSELNLTGLEARLGELQAKVDGTIGLEGNFDVQVAVDGPDVSVLQELLGRPVPPQSFSVAGKLSGTPVAFDLAGLDARLGESDVRGELQIGLGDVTRLHGSLASKFLDVRGWIPDSESPAKAPAKPSESRKYLFDDTPVVSSTDLGLDLDLQVEVARLLLDNTQLRDVRAAAVLNPDGLILRPFSMRGEAGGSIDGGLVLDSAAQVPRIDLQLHGAGIRLGLLAAEGQDPDTFPPIEIDLALSGEGQTRRELASGLDGRMRWYTGPGLVASTAATMLFSDFLTELFQTLNPFAKTSEYTRLDCAVAAADIVDGQVEVFPVIFHTKELTILSKGKIDLKTENIDLSFATKPREGLGLSAGALINPLIKVGGRLAAPSVELDPKGTVVSGGLAVATAGLSILAKSMSDRFLSSKDPCGDARREIEQRDAGGAAKSAD